MEKQTLTELLAAELKPEQVRQRPVRLCFQDEARFGRMVRFHRCWAPSPLRPKVYNGYEREFTCVYGSVSPLDGELDWCLPEFQDEHPPDEGVSDPGQCRALRRIHSHDCRRSQFAQKQGPGDTRNLRLIRLPAYSPELNPQEHVWDDLLEKAFSNRVSANMEQVIAGLKQGLWEMSGDAQRLRSLTAWPWIVSLNLKVN